MIFSQLYTIIHLALLFLFFTICFCCLCFRIPMKFIIGLANMVKSYNWNFAFLRFIIAWSSMRSSNTKVTHQQEQQLKLNTGNISAFHHAQFVLSPLIK